MKVRNFYLYNIFIKCKTLNMYRISTLISILILFTTLLTAQTVTVLPSIKDNSMFSESGSESLGAGKLFTGQNCQGNNRRALIEFDLTSIPTDAVVTSVSLNLGAENSGNNSDGVIEIFGVTRAWGEGFSSGSGNGGPAVAPDATWTDAMFGTVSWDTPGGDFDPALLSSRFTTENNQTINFPSSANFITQAQNWINDPSSNYGIIVIGVETQTCAAYRFGARDIGTVPELVVTWETSGCEPPITDLTIQACESYNSPGGFTYTDSGLYNEVVPGPNDCDSIFNIDLTILLPGEFLINATLCENDDFTLNGIVYDQSNPSGTQQLTAMNGCDSNIIIDLSFIPNSQMFISETLCSEEEFSVIVNGTLYDINNPSGTEILENIDVNGCDSIVTIDLNFLPNSVGEETYVGCQNDGYSVLVNGTIYDEDTPSGSEVIIGGSPNGCDSTINVNLVFHPVFQENITHMGCEGNGFSVVVDGVTYDEMNASGSVFLLSSTGCDSIINIDLFFAPAPNPGMATMPGGLCNKDDAILDLNTLLSGADAGGIWTETSPNLSTGFSGNEFDGTGQNPGTYFFRYTVSATNCPDEFTQVSVNVQAPLSATVTTTGNVCNDNNAGNLTSFDFNSLITGGFTGGIWIDTDGVGVNLNDLSSVDFLGVIEGSFTFTYFTSVIGNCPAESYPVTMVVENCTCPSVTTNQNYNGCEGDNFAVSVNGVVYNEANPNGTEVLTSTVTGCDSIVNINLMFNPAATNEGTFSTCDMSTPPTTTEVITNGAFNGCDSIITLTTVYLDSDETGISATSCNPADVGTVTVNLTNQNGCDSIVTTTTELMPLDNSISVSDATVVATIFGATYQWIDCDNNNAPIMGETDRFFTAAVSGNYAVEIMENGCMVTSECVIVTVVNTEEVWFTDQIDVLPNPTSGAIRLTFGELENVNIRILEVTGKVLLERTNLGGGSADLFLEGPAGLYFVGVEVDGEWGWMRVVKN